MLDIQENISPKYPKIETVFNRDETFKFSIVKDPSNHEGLFRLPGFNREYHVYRKPEYGLIKLWEVTEKIDGTNVRIILKDGKVYFAGKTKNAELPAHLEEKLRTIFTAEKLQEIFENKDVTLYGEGYGAKIQGGVGEKYSDEAEFILFDIKIGQFWLLREDLEHIAQRLNIKVVPLIGYFDMDFIYDTVSEGFPSLLGNLPICEGIVAKTKYGLVDRMGDRLMFKLKHKDFNKSFKPHKQ